MASQIDFSVPVFGNPTTQSVRDQFHTAYIEITALQNRVLALESGGGGGMPAGADGQIQFNNNGAFGASSNLKWYEDSSQCYLTIDTIGPPAKNVYLLMGTNGCSLQYQPLTTALLIQSDNNPSNSLVRVRGNFDVFDGNVNIIDPGGVSGYAYRVNGTPISLDDLDHTNLPLTDPGPGSKKLWCDPGDGHRVKFAV